MALMTPREITEIKDPGYRPTVREEQRIVRKLAKLILSKGYSVSVNDGENATLEKSRKTSEIYEAMRTTDEDYLIVHDSEGKRIGWFILIYGNGEDVVADTSVSPKIDEIWKELDVV